MESQKEIQFIHIVPKNTDRYFKNNIINPRNNQDWEKESLILIQIQIMPCQLKDNHLVVTKHPTIRSN